MLRGTENAIHLSWFPFDSGQGRVCDAEQVTVVVLSTHERQGFMTGVHRIATRFRDFACVFYQSVHSARVS